MLRAVEITRAFGGQVVLDAVSVQLDPGDRVGLVGPNGAGKTTLLRLLAGLDVPDGGRVELAPATLTVGYLPQEPEPQPGETLLAHLERRTGVAAAERALDAATDALAADASALDDYTVALERFLALGGDDFAARAAEVCDRVGLAGMVAAGGARRASTAARFDQEVASLSGGEAARVALAAILLSRADVLLLDEPTNNLDFAGIDLLEAFVDGFTGGVLVVSHDRAFLDRCVDRIVELDDHDHHARAFAGGWSAYVAARELARSQHDAAFARYVAERDRLRARQRRQVQWSETGVRRAKTSGEPDKNLRRKRAERSEKQASKVKATERKLAQLERVDKPWEPWQLRLALRPEARSGQVVARLDGAVVERGGDGGFRLGPVDLEIAWQDRLAILGPNGSGKSTLLGALLGELPLAAGGRWLGPGVRVGLLDQDRAGFGGDEPVLRVFQRETGLPRDEARSLLAKFRLGAEHVDRAGSALSPGERTRAVVAVLMAQGVNCLVLDEPTNHLDVEAIEQLEQALGGFDGTLVVVSHDRRFLEALEITRVLDLGAAGA